MWRATRVCPALSSFPQNFYPRPPCGGRQNHSFQNFLTVRFLSTPSVWRATAYRQDPVAFLENFYPRPPCGGRPLILIPFSSRKIFLSTPSVWRATLFHPRPARDHLLRFLSTPSVWRATQWSKSARIMPPLFLSTPSVWRATTGPWRANNDGQISIHALRVEGDPKSRRPRRRPWYFYPRPPCGGRPCCVVHTVKPTPFLSTPSVWRATARAGPHCRRHIDFYPRPPCGGRQGFFPHGEDNHKFLSTPSVWRATAKVHKILFHFAAQTRKFVVLILQSILSPVLSKPFRVLLYHFSAVF